METQGANYFHHATGLTPKAFYDKLKDYKITSTGLAIPKNIKIVTSYEHKKYPIFAT